MMKRWVRFMKGIMALGLLMGSLFSFVQASSEPAQAPAEVLGVLDEAFPQFQKEAMQDPAKYGFTSASDIDDATIDVGYPVYVIDRKALPNFKGNIFQLESYGQAWDFVVYDAQSVARTYLTVAFDEQEKKFMSSGAGGDPATLLQATQAMLLFAGDRALNIHFVKFQDTRLLVFEFEKDGKPAPYAFPLIKDISGDSQPLDYKQTVEYLKMLDGLEFDEQSLAGTYAKKKEADNLSSQFQWLIWIALFLGVMLIIVRMTNAKLKREREELARLEEERRNRMKLL